MKGWDSQGGVRGQKLERADIVESIGSIFRDERKAVTRYKQFRGLHFSTFHFQIGRAKIFWEKIECYWKAIGQHILTMYGIMSVCLIGYMCLEKRRRTDCKAERVKLGREGSNEVPPHDCQIK